MQKLGNIQPRQDGKDGVMLSPMPTPNSGSTTSDSPKLREAKRQVEKLFNLLPPQDVLDPEAFLAATITAFAEYPIEVMATAATDIPQRTDRATLKFIRERLDIIYEPFERQLERDRAAQSHRLGLPPPSTKRTPEQQARIDAQVEAARHQLGITGNTKRVPVLPPSADLPITAPVHTTRNDGRHASRVMADLEQKRARRESTDPPKESSAA